jgi:hypothetical protein
VETYWIAAFRAVYNLNSACDLNGGAGDTEISPSRFTKLWTILTRYLRQAMVHLMQAK